MTAVLLGREGEATSSAATRARRCSSALAGACASGKGPAAAPTSTQAEDFTAQAADFVSLADMTTVRGFFVDNRLGHLDEALSVANNPDGGVYPVGTGHPARAAGGHGETGRGI